MAGEDRIGTSIDRYRIEALLGRGGFGTVYRARHHVLGRPVALKVLHEKSAHDPAIVERFLREAKAASAIGSPHIVEVYDAGIENGEVFLAMELLEGEDLGKRIDAKAPLPEKDAIAIALEILDGLSAAHAAGIVHRDLKPANVFLARGADGRERVKILDFGISKIVSADRAAALTHTDDLLGTPLYMAPEQLKSAADAEARADLWSFGAILFEMLTARTPYQADTFEQLIVKRMTEAPQSIDWVAPKLSASVRRLISDCIAVAPEDRPPSARSIADGLRAAPLPVTRDLPRAIPETRISPPGAPTIPSPKPASSSSSGWAIAVAIAAFAIPVVLASLCVVTAAAWLFFVSRP